MRRKTVGDVMQRVELNAETVIELSNKVINKYCDDLEAEISQLKATLHNNKCITDNELEMYILNLSTSLFSVGSKMEEVGIKEDISKSIRLEVYNNERSTATGTVSDKNSYADMRTQQETTVNNIYTRSYKKMQSTYNSGVEVLNCLKKIETRRQQEIQLSAKKQSGGREKI